MPHDYYLELIGAKVAPVDAPFEPGIVLDDEGRSKPFFVERFWAAPSGWYNEQWSIRRGGRDVVFEGPAQRRSVRSLQSTTRHVDVIEEPVRIEPGQYQLVFIVEGRFMGSIDIEVRSAGSAAA